MVIISDTVLLIILMNPYLPYILPQTKQMPNERVERERGRKRILLCACFLRHLCSLDNYTSLLNQSPLLCLQDEKCL